MIALKDPVALILHKMTCLKQPLVYSAPKNAVPMATTIDRFHYYLLQTKISASLRQLSVPKDQVDPKGTREQILKTQDRMSSYRAARTSSLQY